MYTGRGKRRGRLAADATRAGAGLVWSGAGSVRVAGFGGPELVCEQHKGTSTSNREGLQGCLRTRQLPTQQRRPLGTARFSVPILRPFSSPSCLAARAKPHRPHARPGSRQLSAARIRGREIRIRRGDFLLCRRRFSHSQVFLFAASLKRGASPLPPLPHPGRLLCGNRAG